MAVTAPEEISAEAGAAANKALIDVRAQRGGPRGRGRAPGLCGSAAEPGAAGPGVSALPLRPPSLCFRFIFVREGL